jgi:hypothetical protein
MASWPLLGNARNYSIIEGFWQNERDARRARKEGREAVSPPEDMAFKAEQLHLSSGRKANVDNVAVVHYIVAAFQPK